MRDNEEIADRRSLLKNALLALDEMQARLSAAEQRRHEPLAVVGMACRFPGGADDPDAYWELLKQGRNAVRQVPDGRWDSEAYARRVPDLKIAWYGGFLDRIDEFDPAFFNISPREANTMDPQQRLVLETGWEALENAGLAPDRLSGSRTGVFLGITTNDYAHLLRSGDPAGLDAYAATGGALNAAAGRLAYTLGLQGPCLTTDTACSSSLVAVHLACSSLRNGECNLAIAGGVNATLTPEAFIAFARWGMMAPDGQCKAFDAHADGFVRGEGCGLIVLKRLSEALADRDPILAVLRGSAVNQDGHSSGLTVPNGLAQQAVIRQALAAASIAASEVSYIETHGTGTTLGDPIEVEALGAAYGEGRPIDLPLTIGSVKTNLGHLESASGIAGLIKVILALQHEEIPPHLHLQERNPRIPWPAFPIHIPVRPAAWRRGTTPRRAGVSSFGFSGTNAHVIVEEAPLLEQAVRVHRPAAPLLLSARSPQALRHLAGRYRDALAGSDSADLLEAACTSATGRAHFNHRLAITAADRAALLQALESFARGADHASGPSSTGVQTGLIGRTGAPRVAFLFTGQGAQYAGMGRRLYETQPVYRQELERCAALLAPHLKYSLVDLLFSDASGQLNDTRYTQPALFALEWALAQLWIAWGVQPSAALGHSVGELVAACLAGVFSLEDGLALIAARARLMSELPAGGGMAAILAPLEVVTDALEPYSRRLSIAAFNGPHNTVVSGDLPALDEFLDELARRGSLARRLNVSHAFHSRRMEPILEAFEAAAGTIPMQAPRFPIFSNLNASAAGPEMATAAYWGQHIRQPVQFERGLHNLYALGCRVMLEIGPQPTLIGMGRACLAPDTDLVWLPSLQSGQDDWEVLGNSLAILYLRGVNVDWHSYYRPYACRRVQLPNYPFERSRYWIEAAAPAAAPAPPAAHPFFTEHFELAGDPPTRVWQGTISLSQLPYLADHCIQAAVILPAAAYLEMALYTASQTFQTEQLRITAFEALDPLVLSKTGVHTIQLLQKGAGKQAEFQIFSRPVLPEAAQPAWKKLAAGQVEVLTAGILSETPTLTGSEPAPDAWEAVVARCPVQWSGADFYRRQSEKGNDWGPAFQGLERLWQGEREAASSIRLVPEVARSGHAYFFHPALADASGHVLVATLPLDPGSGGKTGAFVGSGIQELRVYRRPGTGPLHATARLRPTAEANVLLGDIFLYDAGGSLVSETLGSRLWYLEVGRVKPPDDLEGLFYRVAWLPQDLPDVRTPLPARRWLVLCDQQGVGSEIQRRLEAAGHTCVRLTWGTGLPTFNDQTYQIRPDERADFEWLLNRLADQGVYPQAILHLWSLDQHLDAKADVETLRRAQALVCASLLSLVQALAGQPHQPAVPIWAVTRGGQALPEVPGAVEPGQALLWGFGRALSAEHPEFFAGLIDLDPTEEPPQCTDSLWAELHRAGLEEGVAYRRAERRAARLRRLPAPVEFSTLVCRPESAYLITGGLGGLGLQVAGWLAQRGARHLTLLSRTPLPPRSDWDQISGDTPLARKIFSLRHLVAQGVEITTAALDVTDEAALYTFLEAQRRAGGPPWAGVVHAAGLPQYQPMLATTRADLNAVLAPKTCGAWLLHRYLQDEPLDFFILFSSAAAILASPLASGYAAGNAFLDALASYRQAAGLPATSLNWGFWSEVGMVADFTRDNRRSDQESGMGLLTPQTGLRALETVVQTGLDSVAVMPVDWQRWAHSHPHFARSGYLEELVDSAAVRPACAAVALQPTTAEAAVSPREAILHSICLVLRIPPEKLPLDEPLSHLGLDSLMAMELRTRLEPIVQERVPLIRLLQGPTTQELVESLLGSAPQDIRNEPASSIASDALPTSTVETGKTFELSYNQRAIWLAYQLAPHSPAYNVAVAVRILSDVDIPALRRAFWQVIERHAILRTLYVLDQNEPRQKLQDLPQEAWSVVSIPDWDEVQLRHEIETAYRQPFDLENGPILRATLYTRPGGSSILLICSHHIAVDGWSMNILLRDLWSLYGSASGGTPADLPLPGDTYRGYVHTQADLLAGPEGERLWAYWNTRLNPPTPPLALPIDKERPPFPTFRGDSVQFEIPADLVRRLIEWSRRQGVTLYMTLLAAYLCRLYHWTAQSEFLVGSPTAGRTRPEYEQVVGNFINMLVLKAECSGQVTFTQFVKRVRDSSLAALENQEYPYALLVERLPVKREASRPPLFQVTFDLQRLERYTAALPPDSAQFGGLTLQPFFLHQQEGQFELDLQIAEGKDSLSGYFKYNPDLFLETTICRLAADFLALLEALMHNSDISLSDQSYSLPGLSLADFLNFLRKRDVRLWIENERLRLSAPPQVVNAALQAEIARRKPEIIAFLQSASSNLPADLPLLPAPRTTHLPLSFAQQRLWFLNQMEPNNPAYNISAAFRVSGAFDPEALQAALQEIIQRHESLRTSFRLEQGEPVQVITPAPAFVLDRVDLRAMDPDQQESVILKRIQQEAEKIFDLSGDLLLRGTLIQKSAEEHVVILCTHHIASDAWSMGVMTDELIHFYAACQQGQLAPLAPLPIQYADFAYWQRHRLQGERLEQELDYWKKQLAGPLPVLDLPADHPRPGVQTFAGSRRPFYLSLALWERLKTFSTQAGATLFMTLLAAFNVLLFRYSHQEDILIGSPVAGRTPRQTEALIGFFVNNLVLRTDLSGNPTFRELLARVRQMTLDAYAHQELPFQLLVDRLRPERDLSRMPFFQVLFALQNVPYQELVIPGASLQPILFDSGLARFDLSLEFWERPQDVLLFVEYNTDLFEQATIERLITHYQTLLGTLLEQPNSPVSALPILTRTERDLIVETWNQTRLPYPSGTLCDLFEAQAARTPQAVAVRFEQQAISYEQLNRRANQLAHYLRSLGAGPDSLVAIFLERSIEMVVGLLGILKSGAAYLPLDPIYPAQRLALMLEDSRAPIVLTQAALQAALPEIQARLVYIDTDWQEIARHRADNLPPGAGPEHLAYMIYTSGSTGRPKGVQVLQRSLVNFLNAMRSRPGISAQDVLLAVTTLSFDIAGLEVYLPLICGAQVALVSSAVAADALGLMEALDHYGATILQATPATWRMLLTAGWSGKPDLKALCGGEAFPSDLADPLLERCAEVWNMYGPTETTVWSSVHRVQSGETPIPIGKPIDNTRFYIVDPHLTPLPIGVPGELLIGGDGLARGYFNRPDLNAEKFIPDPFSPAAGTRLYRTGDLARYRPDGCVECLGRLDYQVKIRGFRIELGEIEALLEQQPGVRQAVVVARQDTPGDQRLVAYLVADPAPGLSAVRQALREKLPDYMIPSAFVFLEAFPLTPNGKVDRRRLPAPQGERPELSTGYQAARTATERRLAEIWQELLKLKQVGVEDNFFELGGHSILIVQAHARIKEFFHTDLTVAQMFQYPTLASLGRYLDQSMRAEVRPSGELSLQRIQERAQKQRRAGGQAQDIHPEDLQHE